MKMEEEDKATFERHHTLCTSLNMDRAAADDAWKSYISMRQNYTLEGDQLHWLCCALYVACRRVQTPTVGDPPVYIEGNLVSLTRLLRQCNLSLVQFFNKCKKWADMANLSPEFRTKFDHLERKFEVSMVIFKKYQTLFNDIFNKRTPEELYQHKSKKLRNALCSTSKVFDFCWTLFVTIKASYPAVADDLVNSYHLLLACCDLIYLNALLANRKDLLNPNFAGLPAGFNDPEYAAPVDVDSIIGVLCELHDGVSRDAMGIQQYCWNNQVKKLFEKKIFQGKIDNLTGLLDPEVFESNFKAINKVYDEYPLSVGEFDERIFLSDEASEDIGAPTDVNDVCVAPKKQLAPATPLTNRRWLRNERESSGATPLSTATQSVTRLINLLERKEELISKSLQKIFDSCPDNPQEKIEKSLDTLSEKFASKYNQLNDQPPGTMNFAEERLALAKKLFFKVLEGILQYEEKMKPSVNFSVILNRDIIHQCLFACCLEVIIFTYNSHRTFPWILEALDIEPYYFYRIIEMVLRVEDQLPRDTVKHLSMVEERILESLAWQSGSPLWTAINQQGVQVPKCEDVFVASQLMDENDFKAVQSTVSGSVIPKINNCSQSPGVSLIDRFSSPIVSRHSDLSVRSVKPGQSVLQSKQPILQSNGVKSNATKDESVDKKPKKTGSMSIFFRKFYSLASIRMQDLCMRLRITDIGLMKKIWTCFEYAITNHSLMQDRHLDQILMCSIYVICKVVHTEESPTERSFADIMKCYRYQPQAASHVYRSVLLWKKLPADNPSSDVKSEGLSDGQSAPLTPNSMAGTSNSFDNVERGDLIKFYNSVYVIVVQSFVKMFPSNQKDKSEQKLKPLMSPLPRGRLTPKSPMRRVSQKHSLYIRPFDSKTNLTSGPQTLTYCVNRSPAKDLRAINKMIKGESNNKGVKRSLTDFDEGDTPPLVLPANDAACNKRIQNVLEDRKGQCAK